MGDMDIDEKYISMQGEKYYSRKFLQNVIFLSSRKDG